MYLRVDCFVCGAFWNFYEEKWEINPTTAVNIQGCVCPNCGSIGFIASGKSDEILVSEHANPNSSDRQP